MKKYTFVSKCRKNLKTKENINFWKNVGEATKKANTWNKLKLNYFGIKRQPKEPLYVCY